jgi:hypothetical protein
MLKIRITSLLMILAVCHLGCYQTPKDEWIPLFNGKDLQDWTVKIRGNDLGDNFGNTFRVEDGALTVGYDKYESFDEKFGHIYYKKPYSSYLLEIEYKFFGDQAPNGPGWAIRNSGVMIHGQDPQTIGKDQDFPISIEVQFLGGLSDGKERSTANLCTPGTHVRMNDDLITAHCINSSSKTYNGDQWVRVEVLVLGDSIIKHIVEGDTVLTYTKPQMGAGMVSGMDSSLLIEGKPLTEGYISLQSESHPVAFRKVALFDLAPYRNHPLELEKVLQNLQNRRK